MGITASVASLEVLHRPADCDRELFEQMQQWSCCGYAVPLP
jgi:hypothetical protein